MLKNLCLNSVQEITFNSHKTVRDQLRTTETVIEPVHFMVVV